MQVRVETSEKDGFTTAAKLSGMELSVWVRDRLRSAAVRELTNAGRKIPFID